MQRKAVGRAVLLAIVLIIALVVPSTAGSTGKSLSTNFTLINLGDGNASGSVQYIKSGGGSWKADDSFTNVPPGGQVIYRQYLDSALPAGRGSVIVSADQSLGAVVQILARNQVPTSGAYVGFAEGSEKAYVPLVMSKLQGASGAANSQIVVQNAGDNATDVTIELRGSGASTPATFSKTISALPAGASAEYDLADEAGLNAGWYGSAIISATTGNKIVAVSNLFTGPHGMQTFNAFTAGATGWLVPLFTSRLGNGLSTPIAIQNLSGAPIAAGGITVACTKNPNGPDPATLNVSNPSEVAAGASFNINPVTDMSLPAGWYGSCRVTSSGAVVAFVQMRKIGTDQAAAYEAINANSTDKTVLVPLAAKRLANGFATVATIQNVSTSAAANVTFTYIPSQEYINAGGSNQPVTVGPVSIPAGGSIQHNLRLTSGAAAVTQLPDGWYGTVKIVSSDQPINGIVELTFLTGDGDTYQAHDVFTKP